MFASSCPLKRGLLSPNIVEQVDTIFNGRNFSW